MALLGLSVRVHAKRTAAKKETMNNIIVGLHGVVLSGPDSPTSSKLWPVVCNKGQGWQGGCNDLHTPHILGRDYLQLVKYPKRFPTPDDIRSCIPTVCEASREFQESQNLSVSPEAHLHGSVLRMNQDMGITLYETAITMAIP